MAIGPMATGAAYGGGSIIENNEAPGNGSLSLEIDKEAALSFFAKAKKFLSSGAGTTIIIDNDTEDASLSHTAGTITIPAQSSEQEKPIAEEPIPLSEIELAGHFEHLVDSMSVADFAVPVSERPIKAIEAFSFIPVKSKTQLKRTYQSAGYSVNVRPGVRTTYEGNGVPYLDAAQAVGLVYEGRLIAVAAAGVQDDGNLIIVQIQDVSGVRKSRAGKDFYKTGLHNGMAWRETLVTTWEHIATQIGANRVIIQSNQNNRWDAVKGANGKGYDDLAQRMGYVLDPSTNNWVKASLSRGLLSAGSNNQAAEQLVI